MRVADKDALRRWEDFKINIHRATPVDLDETPSDKAARIARLLRNPEEFGKYYLPHYCQSEFAEFHREFMNAVTNKQRIYVVRKWSRAHAKSVIGGVLIPLFLMCKEELKNMLLVSRTWDNAVELLRALVSELEANQRLIHDFGSFISLDQWETGRWVTSSGVSFRAVGAGQSPRGARNQEARPDYILCDDLDDDEVSRNSKRVDQLWEWMTGALYGCFDITGAARFVVINNVIAKDCIVLRACEVADNVDQIDILTKGNVPVAERTAIEVELRTCRDEQRRKVLECALGYIKTGYRPSWGRFTMVEVAYMITKMGYRMSQREYFNNPISEGKVFKKAWMQFKKLPPFTSYPYPLVAYLDPGFKKTKTSDSKALVLIGLHQSEFHIRKVFVGKASVEEMIAWCYNMDTYVKERKGAYKLRMEEVFLQSLLYKDFAEAAKKRKYPVPVTGDTRKKPDKDARIEALAGYFERGQVFFDESLKEEHHTKELIEQFLAFEPGVRTLKDGPDATEGAIFQLVEAVQLRADVHVGTRKANKHRI